jgi:putative DNA primase/helicase
MSKITAAELARIMGAKFDGKEYKALCPAHDDHDPSLNFHDGAKGRIIFQCRSQKCTYKAITDSIRAKFNVDLSGPRRGNGTDRIDARYPYCSARGDLLYEVVRVIPKDFKQRRPGGSGGEWIWNLKGVERVPYRLPSLAAAIERGETIFIPEGEKDVDALVRIGLTASCNSGGACHWQKTLTPHFKGADVVILPDNDDQGRQHAEQVAQMLAHAAKQIRILALPDLPAKGDVSDWLRAGGTREQLLQLAATSTPKRDQVVDLSEDGIALEFAARHLDKLRFCHSAGAWFDFTGTHWRRDNTARGFAWARDLCREVNASGLAQLKKMTTATAVERGARADQRLAVTAPTWDRDQWLLGTPGGTVELRTGELRPARANDYITKLTSVAPSDSAEPELWLRFLEQATRGDQQLIRFLQQIAGYALTGDIREHALFYIYGDGGTGKGTFTHTIQNVLGSYATVAPMELFIEAHGERHPTELAFLLGGRLVTAVETEKGRAWAQARIKQLTGGDPVTARYMRQDFFTFQPTWKLLLIGNHAPILRNVDVATRRRFNVIPFTFKPDVEDPKLEERLRPEWPGILRWMIEGCLDWQANGLLRPPVVITATADYFEDQDVLGRWIADRCETGRNCVATNADLFRSWAAFAEENGTHPGKSQSLTGELAKLGYRRVKNVHGIRGRGFAGIRPLGPLAAHGQRDPYAD